MTFYFVGFSASKVVSTCVTYSNDVDSLEHIQQSLIILFFIYKVFLFFFPQQVEEEEDEEEPEVSLLIYPSSCAYKFGSNLFQIVPFYLVHFHKDVQNKSKKEITPSCNTILFQNIC